MKYSIANKHIMMRTQFANFKNRSYDEIIRYIKDIIADSNLDDNLDK